MCRRIEISGLAGTLPERVGSFVVGIPRKMIEDLWNKNPSHSDDAIFRNSRFAIRIPQNGRLAQNPPEYFNRGPTGSVHWDG